MKRLYKLSLGLMTLVGLSYSAEAQTSLGTSKSLLSELKKDLSSKSNGRTVGSSVDLDVPGASFSGQVNFKESAAGSEFLIGEIENVQGSSFVLKADEKSLEGHIIIKSTKKAYKYYSDASGNAFVEEVNINGLICIDYENKPAKNQKTEAQAREAAEISEALLDLQSLPGAAGCVLLDFDGYYMPAGNYWNNGNAINAAPSGMSDAAVREHWEVVSEDYRPFNVNITTNEGVYNSYPKNRRMRVVVTPTNTAAPGAGGVAYIGSFNWNNDVPCWVFITSGKSGGDASSHEIGHCFDLQHDGRSNPNEGYFLGLDNSAFAPIMGAGYYRPIVQWSKGEYRNAKNDQAGVLQDDIAVIASSKFGVGFRGDDYGNGTGNAGSLTYNSSGAINQKNGVIMNEADIDFFKFTTGGGNINIIARTMAKNSNLDIIIRLYNSAGQEIASANPTTPGFITAGDRDAQFYNAMHATLSRSVSAGTYYVSIDGTGANDRTNGGYSAYGSIGSYSITGTIPPGGVVVNPSTGTLTVYKDCNNGGFSGGFGVGSYTTAQLAAKGVLNDDISSLTIEKGYKVTLYENDNFTGASVSYTSDQGCLVAAGWNDRASSLRVATNDANIATGTYRIVNQLTNKSFDVVGGSTAEGTRVTTYNTLDVENQKWRIQKDANGFYYMTALHSGQLLDIPYCNYANGTVMQQVNGNNSDCQRFKIVDVGGGFFKIVAKGNGSKVLDGGISQQNNANVYIWEWADVSNQNWKFVAVTAGPAANKAPSVSLTAPANNASYNAPASISITANASDSDGSVSKVEFFNGSTKLGEDATSPYSFTWSNVAVGTYSITAKATDNKGATATSAAASVTVRTVSTNKAPSVALTSPTNNASYNAPASVSIAANASDSDGSVTKVEFYSGSTKLGEDASSPYTFSWSNVAAGTYTVTARATDNSGATTTSASVSITVKTVTPTDQCTGIAQYKENGGYIAGSIVKNAGRKYECKEWPYSGWCNGASWAYAAGTGAYWTDAWYDRGSCTPTTGGADGGSTDVTAESLSISPNPVQGELNISSSYSLSGASIMIIDINGKTVYQSGASESISTSDLNAGIYTLILITADNQKTTKRFVKM